ncbi:MAG: hypothetical protein LBH75_00615 [Treponema sp.]|jgi:hypothetical protein|nr:hypothetical protein [Treponema sp.]
MNIPKGEWFLRFTRYVSLLLKPLAILVLVSVPVLIFFSRAPVLLVTDAAFNELYGGRRILIRSIEIQARLFRRVKQVIIGDEASSDLVSIAVSSASQGKPPFCVLFPSRYAEGAELFSAQNPQTVVVVVGGTVAAEKSGAAAEAGIVSILTDTETDLFRAGLCAAILGKASNGGQDRVAVLQKTPLSQAERASLSAGLKEGGFANVQYIMANSNLYDTEFAVIIMLGSSNSLLDQHLKMPVVLFSWIDPAFTASSVKVIFDDSLWAQAADAVKMAKTRQGGLISSKVIVSAQSGMGKETERELKEAVRSSLQKKL